LKLLELAHQRIVDMQPAGGVDQQDVVTLVLGHGERFTGERHRIGAGM